MSNKKSKTTEEIAALLEELKLQITAAQEEERSPPKKKQNARLYTGHFIDRDFPESRTQGLKDGNTRYTFVVSTRHVNAIRRLAWWEQRELGKIVGEMIELYFDQNYNGIDEVEKLGAKR